jgi:hypothetical protein
LSIHGALVFHNSQFAIDGDVECGVVVGVGGEEIENETMQILCSNHDGVTKQRYFLRVTRTELSYCALIP